MDSASGLRLLANRNGVPPVMVTRTLETPVRMATASARTREGVLAVQAGGGLMLTAGGNRYPRPRAVGTKKRSVSVPSASAVAVASAVCWNADAGDPDPHGGAMVTVGSSTYPLPRSWVDLNCSSATGDEYPTAGTYLNSSYCASDQPAGSACTWPTK